MWAVEPVRLQMKYHVDSRGLRKNARDDIKSSHWSHHSILSIVAISWVACIVVLTAYVQCIQTQSENSQNNRTAMESSEQHLLRAKVMEPPITEPIDYAPLSGEAL
jgi:Na+-transporting NADH:ubiquinone oxidoreductase subunit NqrC